MSNDFDVIEDGFAPGTIPDNPVASAPPASVPPEPAPDLPPTPPVAVEPPTTPPVAPPPAPAVEKNSPGVQKRIDRLVREREELRAQLQAVQRQNPTAPAPAQIAAPLNEPKEEDFKTYTEFIDARADWRYEQKEKERNVRESAQRVQSEQDATYTQFRGRELKVMDQHDDYDDVADAKVLAAKGGLTPVMATMINASPVGPDLLYHLGANVEEARKIAAMPPVQAARALFKLESTFDGGSEPPPVKTSSAPEPINPLTSHPPTNPTNRNDGMEMY